LTQNPSGDDVMTLIFGFIVILLPSPHQNEQAGLPLDILPFGSPVFSCPLPADPWVSALSRERFCLIGTDQIR
jgi:hypothetical protein